MPVFLKDGRAVLFVHVPKTGGTTIEAMFRRSGWSVRLRETRRSNPDMFPLRRCSPQHYHATLLLDLFDVSRFDLTFMLTRDPIARFRSEYAMRNQSGPADPATVSAWADRALRGYAKDPYTLDNHIRPQTEFHLPEAIVYRLEDGLAAVVDELSLRHDLGLAGPVPRRLSSGERGTSSKDVRIEPDLSHRLSDFYAQDFARFGYAL